MANECYKLARELGESLLKEKQTQNLSEPDFSFLVEQVIEIIKETSNTSDTNNSPCGGCKGCGII